MAYGVKLRVSGDYACFTRPEMKVERVSYDVMTPSAARGILEAIHWKPAIRWVIDAIHVLRPIRFQTIKRNEVGAKISTTNVKKALKKGNLEGFCLLVNKNRIQRAAMVLFDVDYIIEAHFDLVEDKVGPNDNEGKHLDMFNRRASQGQCFHQPCLGVREFPARFALVPPSEKIPIAIQEDKDLGIMLWDIAHWHDERPSMFFRASLDKGIMKVPPPDSREILR